jgi:predicted  nucleic acid-binding Zn-ribbon protein
LSTQQSTSPDIATIVAKAVAAKHAKLTAELQDTRNKFAKLEVEILNLHDIINTNAQQIAAATSQATISALTGPESPFVTKEDSVRNQEQHLQTQVQLQSMQASINNMLQAFLTSWHHNPTDEDLENLQTPP